MFVTYSETLRRRSANLPALRMNCTRRQRRTQLTALALAAVMAMPLGARADAFEELGDTSHA